MDLKLSYCRPSKMNTELIRLSIIKHMINELHKEKTTLPYGIIITRIYWYFDLDLSHEIGRKVLDGNVMNGA